MNLIKVLLATVCKINCYHQGAVFYQWACKMFSDLCYYSGSFFFLSFIPFHFLCLSFPRPSWKWECDVIPSQSTKYVWPDHLTFKWKNPREYAQFCIPILLFGFFNKNNNKKNLKGWRQSTNPLWAYVRKGTRHKTAKSNNWWPHVARGHEDGLF